MTMHEIIQWGIENEKWEDGEYWGSGDIKEDMLSVFEIYSPSLGLPVWNPPTPYHYDPFEDGAVNPYGWEV